MMFEKVAARAAGLGLGLLLAAASPLALAKAAPGGWTYKTKSDAMGMHGVVACTASAESIRAGIPPRSGKAVLCVSRAEQEGQKAPLVVVAIALLKGGLIRQEEFTYRIDHQRPLLHSVDPDDDVQALAPTWPKTFAKQILISKTLVVAIPIVGGGVQDATFNVAGLKLPDFGPSEYELARCGELEAQMDATDARQPPDPTAPPKPNCDLVRRQAAELDLPLDR